MPISKLSQTCRVRWLRCGTRSQLISGCHLDCCRCRALPPLEYAGSLSCLSWCHLDRCRSRGCRRCCTAGTRYVAVIRSTGRERHISALPPRCQCALAAAGDSVALPLIDVGRDPLSLARPQCEEAKWGGRRRGETRCPAPTPDRVVSQVPEKWPVTQERCRMQPPQRHIRARSYLIFPFDSCSYRPY